MAFRKLTLVLALFLPALPSLVFSQIPPAASSAAEMHSSYGEKIHIAGIPNSGKINDALFRGAQPHIAALAQLQKLGITTIVDLRSEAADLRQREKTEAERLGMRFVSIPVGGFSPPTNDQVAQFLSLFAASPSEKVFVHCHYGDDRTGVFVATYRMAIEKWPAEQALHEMYFFGFNGPWHPKMKAFIRDFPGRLRSAPVFAPYQTSTK